MVLLALLLLLLLLLSAVASYFTLTYGVLVDRNMIANVSRRMLRRPLSY